MTVHRSIGVPVVIPARNEEKFIRECLLALVGQTRPAAEILVIDNASGDRTAEITRAIAAQFPASGIRLIPI